MLGDHSPPDGPLFEAWGCLPLRGKSTRAQIITDDRELRIRAHQKLKDAGADSFAVLEGKEFQTQFFDYRVALDVVAKEEEG